jgi:hypothetical protein
MAALKKRFRCKPLTRPKIARLLMRRSWPKEDQLRFLELAPEYTGDDCLTWPYGTDSKGYGRISLDGKERIVSRLVCKAAHGEPPTPKHEAAHSCGKGHLACINPHHLSWKTPAQNRADCIVHGTHIRGSDHKVAKLDAERVRTIRLELLRGVRQKDLAKRFGVSRGTVSDIASRRLWGWLDAA